jgi:hypothetical protein
MTLKSKGLCLGGIKSARQKTILDVVLSSASTELIEVSKGYQSPSTSVPDSMSSVLKKHKETHRLLLTTQTFTYFLQLCCSLKPNTSLILRLENNASWSSNSLLSGTFGKNLSNNSLFVSTAPLWSLPALKTW